jgi:nucleosome binding factor SPN SPT16 subunit
MQEHKGDIWDGSNVLAVMAGSASDDLRYLKSVSLHIWLFGYEVTGTARPACHLLCRAAAAHTGQ